MSSIEAAVVVAVDFGTTFSGYAFAHKADPFKIYSAFLWPESDGTYCKTNTELYYVKDSTGQLAMQNWGAEALIGFTQAGSSPGELIKNFKLHLAGHEYGPLSANPLPGTLTPDRVITDYLREVSQFCLAHLQDTYPDVVSIKDVRWCLTVPAIWSDFAKQRMKSCAEAAGMVQARNGNGYGSGDGSPFPLAIVLEPEAAAVYCLTEPTLLSRRITYERGDKFLTADLGGGTVDLVIHEKVWKSSDDDFDLEIREVAKSSGGLCGATYVDVQFMQHLSARIPCFDTFVEENPSTLLSILKWWEGIKKTFNGTLSRRWEIQASLANAWRRHDEKAGCSPRANYEIMEFTKEDIVGIFEPVVTKVLDLIEEALRRFPAGEVKTIMAVGGFSTNAYLKRRLKQKFVPRWVREIVTPPDPGGAISQGAVKLGMTHKDLIVSRISRKTYGVVVTGIWREGDPTEYQFRDENGILRCRHCFSAFVREGVDVPSDYSVTRILNPTRHEQTCMSIQIYSCEDIENPRHVTEAGMVKEGEFEVDLSAAMHLDQDREVAVTMYFGRSSIEVTAKGNNFEASGSADKAIPVAFRGSAFAIANTAPLIDRGTPADHVQINGNAAEDCSEDFAYN